jgi:hypothetical protein
MGEQTDGGPADRGRRFTDRGRRFTQRGQQRLGRRQFLGKAGIAGLAVGTGVLLAGCQFNDGPYQGASTGQSSTSGQHATATPTATHGSSGSQSGMSS